MSPSDPIKLSQTSFPLINLKDEINFLFKNEIKKIEIINHLKNTTTMGDISPVDILPAMVLPAQPIIAKQSSKTPFFKINVYIGLNTERRSLFKKHLVVTAQEVFVYCFLSLFHKKGTTLVKSW